MEKSNKTVAQDHVEDWQNDDQLRLFRFLNEDEVPDDVKYRLRDDSAIERWIQENPVIIKNKENK
jgi:hypothetical protein